MENFVQILCNDQIVLIHYEVITATKGRTISARCRTSWEKVIVHRGKLRDRREIFRGLFKLTITFRPLSW